MHFGKLNVYLFVYPSIYQTFKLYFSSFMNFFEFQLICSLLPYIWILFTISLGTSSKLTIHTEIIKSNSLHIWKCFGAGSNYI